MWPKYLDLTSDTCSGILRRLELEAYSNVVSALRAQGDLTKERRKILQDLSNVLNISIERHKAEIRRAVNDELLSTIASYASGPASEHEWAREGRRIIPLLRRATPINAFTNLANKNKADVENYNRLLKSPLDTRTPVRTKNRVSSSRDPDDKVTDVSEMIYTTDNGDVRVKPPSVSVPPVPPRYKALQEFFGGDCDVVILPSGCAVRIKNNPPSEIDNKPEEEKKHGGRRKRKQSEIVEEQPLPTKAPAPSYQFFPPGWHIRSPTRPPPPVPQNDTPQSQSMSMPPPSLPTGRKGISTRGGRKSQGATPRPRKPRVNKMNKGFPVQNDTTFQQHQQHQQQHQQQIIIQHQQQQQQQQHSYHKTTGGTIGAIQMEALNLATPKSTTTPEGHQNTSQSPLSSTNVVIVSSSPMTSSSGSYAVTSKSSSSAPVPTIMRQNLVSVSLPSSLSGCGTGALRLPNIPQMISAAFANGANLTSTPKSSTSSSTITSSTTTTVPISSGALTSAHQLTKSKSDDGTILTGTHSSATLKVIPAGTRILPKPGTQMIHQPLYMVAGQNVMRLTRPLNDDNTTATSSSVKLIPATRITTSTVGGLGLQQRIVTVNTTSAMRPTLSAIRAPGTPMHSLTRMVQPRVLHPPASGGPRPSMTDKPSVIVLQKGTPGKALIAKDGSLGQRLVQTKGGISKPIVIMSKPSNAISTTIPSDTFTNNSNAQQGNVIVLDLSQENKKMSSQSNSAFSDLFQSSGGLTDGNNIDSSQPRDASHDQINHRQPQQVLLQQRTPPEKVSSESPAPSWTHANSVIVNDEANDESLKKVDIFSQAIASANIEEFATDTESF